MVYQLSRITSFLPNLFGFKFNTCQIYYSSLVLFSNSLSKGWVSRQKNSRNSRNRSSCLEFHVKQDVPKNFAKSTGKHQRQSPSFNKVAGLTLQLYYKRDSGTGAFLWILQNIYERIFYGTLPVFMEHQLL